MKNGGGSKADEAMQGETTGNLEDENILKRPSDDDDVVCSVHFIGFHSTEGCRKKVGKEAGFGQRVGWIEWNWLMMMMMLLVMMMMVLMMTMTMMMNMMRRGFGQIEGWYEWFQQLFTVKYFSIIQMHI